MTPEELRRAADCLLTDPTRATAGLWPRAAALLLRQALEARVDEVWRRFAPGVEEASMRVQLLCLPAYLHADPGLAREVGWVWGCLSRACHAHAYEMAPTAGEIRGWGEVVGRLGGWLEGVE